MKPKLLAAFKAAGYDNLTVTATIYGRKVSSTNVTQEMFGERRTVYRILDDAGIPFGSSMFHVAGGINECHTPHLFDCGEWRLTKGEWQFKPYTPPAETVTITRKPPEDDAPKKRKK